MMRNYFIVLLLLIGFCANAQTIQDSVKTQPLSQFDSIEVAPGVVFPVQFVRNDSSLWAKFSVRALHDYLQAHKLPRSTPFDGQILKYAAGQDSLTWFTPIVDSTRLIQDSILVYYQNSSVIRRDTISGVGGVNTETDPIYAADAASLADTNYVLEKVNAQATSPQYIAFNDTLSFSQNTYYQPYTQTDTLNLFADTTGQESGNWVIARVSANGDPINFIGQHWDTLQRYNIADGESLDSASQYMFYFESQPYGVTVNVPQNIGTQIPVGGGGELGQAIGNLLYEIDASDSTMFSNPNDSTLSVAANPTENGFIFTNPTAISKPDYRSTEKEIGIVEDYLLPNQLADLSSGNFTLVWALEHLHGGDDRFNSFGGASGYFQSRSSLVQLGIPSQSSVTINYSKTAFAKVLYILEYDNGTFTLYADDMDTPVGTGNSSGNTVPWDVESIGDYTGTKPAYINLSYHAVFTKALTQEERASIKTYINNTFGFGI